MTYETFIEEEDEGEVRLRFARAQGYSGGEPWDSATLLALVDAALRAAVGSEASLSHLSVTMLKPAQAADVVAMARIIKRDGPNVHAEAWLFSHAPMDPMLHATATLKR